MMGTATDPRARHRSVVAAGLLAALALVTFLPVLGNDFINLDDSDYVTENPVVRRGLTARGMTWALTAFHAANWHPVTWLSHMLDVSLFGLEPRGHHLTSLLFHVAGALLLFACLRSLTGALGRSLAAAALFAVHPLRVESVAWVAERKDVLAVFFFMLALAAYLRFLRRPGPARYLALVLLCALGLMAKPLLVTLPVLFLLFDFWPLGRFNGALPGGARGRTKSGLGLAARLLAEKLPLFALALASGLITLAAQSSRGAVAPLGYFPLGMRLGNAANSLVTYLGKTIWPKDLVVFYIHPGALPWWRAGLTVAALAGIFLLCALLVRRRPWLLVGWLWFAVALLPAIGIVQVGEQGMADRYTYLPHVGLVLAAVWTFGPAADRRARARWVARTASVAAVAVLAVLSRRQLGHWENSLTLMRHTIRVQPNTWWAYNNLGIVLSQEGRPEEALEKLDVALRLRPGFPLALFNKGLILKAQGKVPEAERMFREALEGRPDYVEARVNLGMTLFESGRPEEAAQHYEQALAREPDNLQALTNLGNALAGVGSLDEALAEYARALEIDDGQAEVHYNRGTVLARKGEFAAAASAFQRAAEIDPRYAEARNNLGAALMMLGRLEEARAQILEALRLKPGYRSAEANLERLEARRAAERKP